MKTLMLMLMTLMALSALADDKDVAFVHYMGQREDMDVAVQSIKYNLGVDNDTAYALLSYCAVGMLSRSKSAMSEGLYASVPATLRPKLRKWVDEMIDFGSQTMVVITRPPATAQ